MRNLLYITIGLLVISSCQSKKEKSNQPETSTKKELVIDGKIENPAAISGKLNIMGFLVEPLYSGKIHDDGTFTLTLPTNFDTVTQKAFDDYNKQDEAAYELKMNTVAQTFLNLDGLKTSGLHHEVALAGKYYGFPVHKEETRHGAIYPTSTPEFMTYILEQQREGAITGHYYCFIYATHESIIQGTTSFDEYLDNETESTFAYVEEYDISLRPGWNIVKYEILKTITTSYGTNIPAHIKQQTVQELDKNTLWYHIAKKSQVL